MKTIWPAATIALAITGYFAWSSYSTSAGHSKFALDECHRLAGQVQATHKSGGLISPEVRSCSVTFGQDWAADSSHWAESLRAEGTRRVQ